MNHTNHRQIHPLLAGLLLLALTGCQRAVFEHRGEPLGCDTDIIGRWEMIEKESAGMSTEPASEPDRMAIEIDAVCTLRGSLTEEGVTRDLGETAVSTSKHGSRRFLWVDQTWANRAFEVPVEEDERSPGAAAGWYAYAYGVRRDSLRLRPLDVEALAADVVRDRWDGDVVKQDSSLWVRVEEKPEGVDRLLRKAELARDKDDRIELQRAAPEVERE